MPSINCKAETPAEEKSLAQRSMSLNCVSLQDSDQHNPKSSKQRSKRDKYMKIDGVQRQTLVNLVVKGGFTIKEAADELGLKFSTSKAIVKLYREEGKLFRNEPPMGQNTRDKQTRGPSSLADEQDVSEKKVKQEHIHKREPKPDQNQQSTLPQPNQLVQLLNQGALISPLPHNQLLNNIPTQSYFLDQLALFNYQQSVLLAYTQFQNMMLNQSPHPQQLEGLLCHSFQQPKLHDIQSNFRFF